MSHGEGLISPCFHEMQGHKVKCKNMETYIQKEKENYNKNIHF